MAINKDKNNEKGTFVYKSVINRKSILVPLEYHRLLKFEAMKQKMSLKEFVVEMIKSYLDL